MIALAVIGRARVSKPLMQVTGISEVEAWARLRDFAADRVLTLQTAGMPEQEDVF